MSLERNIKMCVRLRLIRRSLKKNITAQFCPQEAKHYKNKKTKMIISFLAY